MTIPVRVRRLPHNQDLPLPAYATAGAAGMDLLAAVVAPVTIASGARVLIPTGLAIALPEGYELQIRPRSGLALRYGIVLPNSPGTIDEDYRGEIQVIVLNTGAEPFIVNAARGSRRRCWRRWCGRGGRKSRIWTRPRGTRGDLAARDGEVYRTAIRQA